MIPKKRPDIQALLINGPLAGTYMKLPAGTGTVSRMVLVDDSWYEACYEVSADVDDRFEFFGLSGPVEV
jgi:hypothetical protein